MTAQFPNSGERVERPSGTAQKAPSTATEAEQPRRKWPLILIAAGALCILEYFYKYSFEVHDLLLGLGFLCAAPQAYYRSPPKFSELLTAEAWKLHLENWSDWLALAGCVLLLFALTARWL